jgi:hypothetical protein
MASSLGVNQPAALPAMGGIGSFADELSLSDDAGEEEEQNPFMVT